MVHIDVGHLLRIPPDHQFPHEPEDEFKCTNLDVTMPSLECPSAPKKLPVFVWIHGGSQAVTFGSAASGICDMTTIVADSARFGTPIIAVSIQYRLNVFAVGSKPGPPNLALRDQELALHWIQDHIAGFNGDPQKVTLAGESAGAVYTHAHLVTRSPANQFILSSGSLYLSPPQPPNAVLNVRESVSKQLRDMDATLSLENATVTNVVEGVKRAGLGSFFLEWEDRFEGWEISTGNAKALMLSDVQKEAVIWQNDILGTDHNDIVVAFDAAGDDAEELKKLYHIYPDRPSSCKTGALDFINDLRFLLPIHRLEKLWKEAGKPVYRCHIDEANPWQPSAGAHHAVDLLFLFNGLDLNFTHGAKKVGGELREAWIDFINMRKPWPSASESPAAFGPHGYCREVYDWDLQSLRRVAEAKRLATMDQTLLTKAFITLAAGKVSLLN
ncbi:hypothetical protein NW752_002376 [Fusarium irregulare]|nr:hypothetical protein NW752_002376 [Fusarium irregulare]